jgi:hypothetical protein
MKTRTEVVAVVDKSKLGPNALAHLATVHPDDAKRAAADVKRLALGNVDTSRADVKKAPRKKASHPEHDAQVMLVQELIPTALGDFPELADLYAIPNELQIAGLRGMILNKWLQLEGKKAGMPDMCLPHARTIKRGTGMLSTETRSASGAFGVYAEASWQVAEFSACYVELKIKGHNFWEHQRERLIALRRANNACALVIAATPYDVAHLALEVLTAYLRRYAHPLFFAEFPRGIPRPLPKARRRR